MVDFNKVLEESRRREQPREETPDRPAAPAPREAAVAEPPRRAEPRPAPAEGAEGAGEALVGEDEALESAEDPDAAWKAEPYSYLAGIAGTGKTFYAKEWAAREKGVVLAATTGIAAINLGGQTINGLLGYFDTESLRDAYVGGFLESRLRKLHQAGLRRIILDEVSMLDGQQLTIFAKVLEELGGRGYAFGGDQPEYEGEEPEGPGEEPGEYPVKLTVVGDFAQLPPVKAPFAFESPEWWRFQQATKKLTEIRRQTDRDFVEALHAVRRGDPALALEYFGDRLVPTTDNSFDGPTLLARNESVWRFNDLRLSQLRTPETRWSSTRWVADGHKPRSEWKLIPDELILKEQALVMILANARDPEDPRRFLYVNGDLGHLVSQEGSQALVRLERTEEVVRVVPVTREIKIPLEVGRAKKLKAEGLGDRIEGRWEIVGGVTYMPLRCAYATTVHKSQGLSLDKVQVNIRDHFFSTPGMLYVSLSRARTSEGLRLVGSPTAFAQRCSVDAKVAAWL